MQLRECIHVCVSNQNACSVPHATRRTCNALNWLHTLSLGQKSSRMRCESPLTNYACSPIMQSRQQVQQCTRTYIYIYTYIYFYILCVSKHASVFAIVCVWQSTRWMELTNFVIKPNAHIHTLPPGSSWCCRLLLLLLLLPLMLLLMLMMALQTCCHILLHVRMCVRCHTFY